MLRAQSGHRPYARLLEIITDRVHPEHRETLTWCSGRFDPEAFNFDRTNRDIQSDISREPPHSLPAVTGHANCRPPVIKIVVAQANMLGTSLLASSSSQHLESETSPLGNPQKRFTPDESRSRSSAARRDGALQS
jgi:hypothetical protein